MDKVRDAIESLTLLLAIGRYQSAASNGDSRSMGLTVAWVDRELDGWRRDAFFEAIHVDAASIRAAELKEMGVECSQSNFSRTDRATTSDNRQRAPR